MDLSFFRFFMITSLLFTQNCYYQAVQLKKITESILNVSIKIGRTSRPFSWKEAALEWLGNFR